MIISSPTIPIRWAEMSRGMPNDSQVNVTNFRVNTDGGWFIYAVWQENNLSQTSVIYFDRSVDGGRHGAQLCQ